MSFIVITFTGYIFWLALVIKKIELIDGQIVVSGHNRTEVMPLSAVLGAEQRRWPKHHPVRLILKDKCFGKHEIYFIPAMRMTLDLRGERSLWRRWKAHPIVAEINLATMGSCEPCAPPNTHSPSAQGVGGR
jgi:hypothetical protein